MRLKGLVLKGFKSFPDRTALEFAPGVSVVVGPNGSGKSNVTDAVLWAMGEQSPLAVRGQSMQDVIFSGGHGRQGARSAEVELVFDNSGGELPVPAAEVSIVRRLDRNGEGEYRINGARCRMTDVLELLSDSGLGKEGHSVIGQGRVEAIVTSKPRDRRLLIEEAAGLGKHRRRRRRAQLKLDRTRDNLDRALDVEREARTHLRPLKRQAEAAETHARLERQILEARWTLVRDDLFTRQQRLAEAEAGAVAARAEREALGAEAAKVAAGRAAAEEELASRAKLRDDLARRTFAVRTASERIGERVESVRSGLAQIESRIGSDSDELARIEAELATGSEDPQAERRAKLGERLAELDSELGRERSGELAGLEAALAEAGRAEQAAAAEVERAGAVAVKAVADLEQAREAQSDADRGRDSAAADLARAERELERLEAFLRENGGAPAGARSLADGLEVEPGCELAVAAALGGLLSAAVVDDLDSGSNLLDRAGEFGGRAIVLDGPAAAGPGVGAPPAPSARNLSGTVSGDTPEARLARSLLVDAWLVDDLGCAAQGFSGTVVTAEGLAWTPASAELHQVARAGAARVLAERNRLDGLREGVALCRSGLDETTGRLDAAREALTAAQEAASVAAEGKREAIRAADAAAEERRRAEWLIDARKSAPQAGPVAVERAEVAAELAAEERIAARIAAERDGNAARLSGIAERLKRDRALTPTLRDLIKSLEQALEAVGPLRDRLDSELAGDGEQGEGVASRLRELAADEASIQSRLNSLSERVTMAEVEAQRLRDRRDESESELAGLASKLGLEDTPPDVALADDERESLSARVERLERRRAQLGPVNPLAAEEYKAALEHLETLEEQRKDLEAALAELKGLVRDCDRTIKETFEQTFEAASEHFEDLVGKLFPGGKGRLRLVAEESGPKQVLGGSESEGPDQPDSDEGPGWDDPSDTQAMGVEIEITPAGKTMRRLSLLSGGEKSMTAIAFIFAVFLAKPCPFYILDEVEAALDDLNLGRFLELLKAYRDQAQFIVVTHQRRTMEAADALYGVSMGGDGVSKVISRRLAEVDTDDPRMVA